MTVLLFSYGTLQNHGVQMASFGRGLTGRKDSLLGYAKRMVAIADPGVVELSGEPEHPNLVPSPGDAVDGTVFEITGQELTAADQYEKDGGYSRIAVTLQSGTQAWVYLRP